MTGAWFMALFYPHYFIQQSEDSRLQAAKQSLVIEQFVMEDVYDLYRSFERVMF